MHGIDDIFVDFIEKLPEVNKPIFAAMLNEISDRAYQKIGECLKTGANLPEYLLTYVNWMFGSIGADHITWENCTKDQADVRFIFW